MCSTECVVLALIPPRKARQPATLAKSANTTTAPREDLMRIGLVPNVPDETIPRCIEHIVQRHRELDDSKARAEMPACDGHRIDGFLAQLGRKLREVGLRQSAQVVGRYDPVEQRSR